MISVLGARGCSIVKFYFAIVVAIAVALLSVPSGKSLAQHIVEIEWSHGLRTFHATNSSRHSRVRLPPFVSFVQQNRNEGRCWSFESSKSRLQIQ